MSYKCKDCISKISRSSALYGLGRCKSCSRKGKLHPRYRNGKYTYKHFCRDCNKEINADSKRCLSCGQKYRLKNPKNHPLWQGGISKRGYSHEFNLKLKNKIRERDKHICRKCYKFGKYVHHIDYNKQNCAEDNLITLCNNCNCAVNSNRDYWYAYFIYLMFWR